MTCIHTNAVEHYDARVLYFALFYEPHHCQRVAPVTYKTLTHHRLLGQLLTIDY